MARKASVLGFWAGVGSTAGRGPARMRPRARAARQYDQRGEKQAMGKSWTFQPKGLQEFGMAIVANGRLAEL